MEKLNLTQEWDKVFPKSDQVDHQKVTFHNRYGITLAADLYTPKDAERGSFPQSFSRNDVQMTTEPGDIVLYSGDQLVVFFGSNSWSYTKLGHINLATEKLTELLGGESAVIELK